MELVPSEHDIVPARGQVSRARDGRPGSLLDPTDYPLAGECLTCGEPIWFERYSLLASWEHITGPRQLAVYRAQRALGAWDSWPQNRTVSLVHIAGLLAGALETLLSLHTERAPGEKES